MQDSFRAVAITRDKKVKRKKEPEKRTGVELLQIRNMVHAQFEEAYSKGEDITALKESLCMRFNDPLTLSIIEEEYKAFALRENQILSNTPEASKTSDNQEKKPSVPETPTEVYQDEHESELAEKAGLAQDEKEDEEQAKKIRETPHSEATLKSKQEEKATGVGGNTLKRKKGGESGNTRLSSEKVPLALQDIKLASVPLDGRLPSFSESLNIDLQKYAEEKAYHDAWNLDPTLGKKHQIGFQEPRGIVLKAIGKGALVGFLRGLGDLALAMTIEKAGKRIPYLGGFAEIAQFAFDPKGWISANKESTLGKLKKGWSDAFGAGKDFVTRIEGIINLLDGVANGLGLIGTICQALAGVLFVGGLIGSMIFGAGSILLAGAAFLAKAGLMLSEISTLIKIGTTGLRAFLIAGRAIQILGDKGQDPETLQKRAESLEKATEEWTKEFAKTKTKKLIDKRASTADKQQKKSRTKSKDSKKTPTAGKQPQGAQKGYQEHIKKILIRIPKSLESRKHKLGALLSKKKVELREARKKKLALERPLQQEEKKLSELRKELEKIKRSLKVPRHGKHKNQKLKALHQKKSHLNAEIAKQEKKLQEIKARIEPELNATRSQVETLENEVSRIKQEYDALCQKSKELAEKIQSAAEMGKRKPILGGYAKQMTKEGAHALAKIMSIENQYISVPQKLPKPPVQDEAEIDRQAQLYAELTEQIGQIEFQKRTLEEMQRDAEEEKTGLDVLNKLALANLAQTQNLKNECQSEELLVQQKEQEGKKMAQATDGMKSGPGAKTGNYVPFLARLANLLGMVPKKMAPNASEGAAKAQSTIHAIQQFEKARDTTTLVTQGVKNQVEEQKRVLAKSNQEVQTSEARLIQIKAQQLALEAELMEGKAFIAQGLKLADQKKAEKESERNKAHQEYLAAKKRLLMWALLHEQLRKGEESSLDSSVREVEETVSSQ